MAVFTYADSTMHYSDIGQGEVIVFGHSYLCDGSMWDQQIEVLSQHYRCIVPDFWGHGKSDLLPANTKDLTDYAEQVLALLDSLNIEKFSLCGLSLGGMWAVEAAILAKHRVQTLALLNTFVGMEPEVNCLKYNKLFEAIQSQSRISPEFLDQILPLFFSQHSISSKPEFLEEFSDSLVNADTNQIEDWIRVGKMIFSRKDRFDPLEQFALPALIISGSEDRSRTPLESYLMQDAITGSQLEVIPGAAHLTALEAPEQVTRILEAFYTRTLSN